MHKMNHIVISTEHSFTQTHSRAQSKQITFNIDMNSRSENRVMLVKGETHQLYNKKNVRIKKYESGRRLFRRMRGQSYNVGNLSAAND